ncbi:YugN family protein [Scopulibacillus cellulosilyticus]|uniref:YugN family protein n=1 Tax=Scopulibacillus cellulosilyticus TaxID=2665665 RepID=A0ABW2PSP1_9BACL
MKFEDTGLDGMIIPFPVLEAMTKRLGLIRGGHWDWERVTYDFKFENTKTGHIHYLRVPGIAVEGEIEKSDAKVKLLTPYLGRHYYPHGVEYKDEEFPERIINICKERLSKLKEALEELKENTPID